MNRMHPRLCTGCTPPLGIETPAQESPPSSATASSRRPVSCDFEPSRCQLSATNARWILRIEPTTHPAEVLNYPFHLRSGPVSLSSVGSALIGNAEGGRDGKRRCPQQISIAVIARGHRVA
jgi:hypothetical protein